MRNIYSNPRTFAGFNDWPYGRKLRCRCEFTVEALDAGTHKERISKVTINPKTGRPNKPKKTTFAPQVRIVDGSDGKTYILQRSNYGETLYIKKSDFYDFESIRKENEPERYAQLDSLFDYHIREEDRAPELGS
jgi:hypothetical protein